MKSRYSWKKHKNLSWFFKGDQSNITFFFNLLIILTGFFFNISSKVLEEFQIFHYI